MPHYFFDVHDGIHVVDDVGQDLPDLDTAKVEAVRIAGGFATRPAMLGEDSGALVVVVRTRPDFVMMTIQLAYNIVVSRERIREEA